MFDFFKKKTIEEKMDIIKTSYEKQQESMVESQLSRPVQVGMEMKMQKTILSQYMPVFQKEKNMKIVCEKNEKRRNEKMKSPSGNANI